MIRCETVEGGIHRIAIDRPEKRNALGVEHYARLADAFRDVGDAAVVILSSEGQVFCAGNDLGEFASEWPQPPAGPVVRFLTALSEARVPVIAAVQGPAVGIGATLLLHCDLVIASRKASLRYPFVSLGLAPEGASSRLLPRRLGQQRAMELLISGRPVQADEALALGLVTSVVEEEELMPHALSLARQIAAQPRAAIAATKALVMHPQHEDLVACFEREIEAINTLILQGRQSASI